MRTHRLAIVVVLAVAACQQTASPLPQDSRAQSAAPIAPPGPYALDVEIRSESDVFAANGERLANGDETLTFVLDFHADMDRDSVTAAVVATVPQAGALRWETDQRARVDVPPGNTPITIDVSGARSRAGNGIVRADPFVVRRPTSSLSFFDPAALLSGRAAPLQTHVFRFAAQRCCPRFDRSGATVLLFAAAAPAFVDLATGTRTPVPDELAFIARNGAAMFWLSDGRFLTVGTSSTIVGGPRGEDRHALPTVTPGQIPALAPSGDLVALASYVENSVAVLDLRTNDLRALARDRLRCSARASASLAWSPDSRVLAIGSCTDDMAGHARTILVDVRTGRDVASIDGWYVTSWLPSGNLLARAWSSNDGSEREADPGLALISPAGVVLHRFDTSYLYAVSPDGRWLLDAGPEPAKSSPRLVEVATGRSVAVGTGRSYPTFAPDGRLAMIE